MIGDDIYLDILKAKEFGIKTIWANSKELVDESTKVTRVNSAEEISKEMISKL